MKVKLPLKPATTKVAKTEGQEGSKDQAILKMTFPVANYPTEAAVKAYLDKNRFDGDITISKGKDDLFFTAASKLAEADLTDIRQVPCEKGALAFVGKIKAPESDDEDDSEGDEGESASKLAAPFVNIKRFSWYDAYYDESKDPIDILKAGMKDGLPPGMEDIMFAVTRSIANVIKDAGEGDMGANIDNIGSSMAKLVKGVANLYVTLSSEATEKAIKGIDKDSAAVAFKTMIDTWIEKNAGDVTDAALQSFADAANIPAEGDDEKDPALKGVKVKAVKEVDMSASIAEAVGKAVGALVAPLNETVTKLVSTQEGITKRLDDAEKRAPTRKAALDAEIEKVTPEVTEKDLFGRFGLAGGLGFGSR
jgi:hypothetical protein